MILPSHNFTLFTFLSFLILHSTAMHTTAYHWILLNPLLNFPSMTQSQVHLQSGFPNNFLWISHLWLDCTSKLLVKSANYDIVQHKIFSPLLLLPTHNTDIYPTGSSTSQSYITIHYRTDIFKKSSSHRKSVREVKMRIKLAIIFHWFTVHWWHYENVRNTPPPHFYTGVLSSQEEENNSSFPHHPLCWITTLQEKDSTRKPTEEQMLIIISCFPVSNLVSYKCCMKGSLMGNC